MKLLLTILGRIWASPITLAGALLALLTGSRP